MKPYDCILVKLRQTVTWIKPTSNCDMRFAWRGPTRPELKPPLSEPFKASSHTLWQISRNRHAHFCQPRPWDKLIWKWSRPRCETSCDLLLQLPPLLPRWPSGGGGAILRSSRTRCNSLWQHLKWAAAGFSASEHGWGGWNKQRRRVAVVGVRGGRLM